jgi:hypothetical protein
MFSRARSWVVALSTVGCAAPVGPPPTAGYVLLDREARAGGTLSIGSWRGAPRLPVSADVGDAVAFAGPDGPRAIELRPGALAYLHGASPEVEWVELGVAAKWDSLLLEGTAGAAQSVASTVGGTVAQAGQRHRITVSQAYFKLAFSQEPDGLAESFPDYASEPQTESAQPLAANPAWSQQAERAVHDVADIVGVYVHEGRLLVIDASGHYTIDPSCLGEDRPTGQAAASDGRVVLTGDRGRTLLSIEGDDLVETSGRRFTLMRPEPPPARKPSFGLSAILDEP